jgi:hypothetical protein
MGQDENTGQIYSFYSLVFGDLRGDLFYAFYLLMAPGAAARAARFLCGHLFTWLFLETREPERILCNK